MYVSHDSHHIQFTLKVDHLAKQYIASFMLTTNFCLTLNLNTKNRQTDQNYRKVGVVFRKMLLLHFGFYPSKILQYFLRITQKRWLFGISLGIHAVNLFRSRLKHRHTTIPNIIFAYESYLWWFFVCAFDLVRTAQCETVVYTILMGLIINFIYSWQSQCQLSDKVNDVNDCKTL